MIKSLRKNFIVTTMSLLFVVIAAMLAILNMIIRNDIKEAALAEMNSLASASRVPRFMLREDAATEEEQASTEIPAIPTEPEKAPLPDHSVSEETDHLSRRSWTDDMAFKEMYALLIDESGVIINRVRMFDFGMEEEALTSLTNEAIAEKHSTGRIGSYLFLKVEKANGTMVILRNFENDLASCRQMLLNSALIGLATLFVLFIITYMLARKVTAPVARAFKQQKQFIADASHELKTPLSAIAVNADVLKGEIGQNRWLDNIILECGQMEELVLSLLTLAKLEAVDKLPVEKQTLDLSALCSEAALSFESIAYEKGLTLTDDIQAGIGLSGSRSELKRLVTALLENAFKYSDAHGSVEISLKHADQKAVLRVSNTGPDIDPEALPHLFERFYRVDSSRTGEQSFGLGLAIASEIVSRHNGKISVTSTGGKTVFTVIL